MDNQILPELDQFSDQNISEATETELAQKAAERFSERHLEWAEYDTPKNEAKLYEWCHIKSVPITDRNLDVAFYTLTQSGEIQKDAQTVANNEAEKFMEQCPEWDTYRSAYNGAKLDEWLEFHDLQPTTDNLARAFRACVAAKRIQPINKYSGPTVRPETEAERQVRTSEFEPTTVAPVPGQKFGRGEHLSARKIVSIDPQTERNYRASIKPSAARDGHVPGIGEARAAVGNANPELDIRSPEFSRLVSEHIANNRA